MNLRYKSNYEYHISLSYKIIETTKDEEEVIDQFLNQLFKKHFDSLQNIKITSPTLVAFNDMSEFRDLKLGRKDLGFY